MDFRPLNDVERRQLRGGQHKVFVLFEKRLKAPPDLAVGRLGVRQIHTCQPQPVLDLPFECVLETIRVLLQPRAIRVRRIPCAENSKRDLGGREVGFCLFHNAPQRFKRFAMPIHHGAHARVERRPTKIFEPGHAHALEAAVKGTREEFSGFMDRERSAGVRPRNGTQCERQVGH